MNWERRDRYDGEFGLHAPKESRIQIESHGCPNRYVDMCECTREVIEYCHDNDPFFMRGPGMRMYFNASTEPSVFVWLTLATSLARVNRIILEK